MAQIDPITGLPSSNVQTVYAGDKPISPAPVISATKIGTTTASPVPSPVVPTINPTQATQMASYVDASSQTAEQQAAQQAQMEADAQKARGQAMMTDYAQSQALLGGKQGDLATAYNTKDETGNSVNSLAAQLRQLNAQAQGLQLDTLAKQQGEINKATGQNITQQAVARNTADATRENLINMATIGIKTAIAKADYDTAKSYADQMVDAKYSQMEANLKSKEIQMNWVLEQDIKPAQKAAAEAKLREIEAQKEATNQRKADEKDVEKMIIDATPNAPVDVVNRAKKLAEGGASKLAVAQALGVYGGDYLKTQLLKAQIDTEKAQKAKYYADIDKIKSEMNTKGVPTTTENIAKVEASQSAYQLANELKTLSGKKGAVGAGIGKFFGVETGFSGTDRANYEAKFNQLKDTLASANLDKLKGAMSDKDIQFLRNIGTALNLSMSEEAFDTELDKIANVMANVPGVQKTVVAPKSNKFLNALGVPSQAIQGTTIIKSVDDSGNINFNIPK